jgi:dinuclear metal center YbgI/SA1388 family protein
VSKKLSKGGRNLVARNTLEEWLNSYLEVEKVADYLPNGLQIEGKDKIAKIVTAVSINLEVVEAAVESEADAIVVHHGMFWKSDEPVIRGYRKLRIKKIIENSINLFAYHLPLDLHPKISNNRLILKGLGVDKIEEISDTDNRYSFGLKGIFESPLDFNRLIQKANDFFETETRFFQYGRKKVSSLYVVSGAGRNMVDQVSRLEVDAYLTGDAQESTKYVAKEEHLNYIFAGHYNTEKPGIEELGEKIKRQFLTGVKFIDVSNPL